MYYLGKVIASATRELFRWLLWNKTGQKVLVVVLVFLIGFFFIKLGEVAAAEPSNFDGYEEISFDGSLSAHIANRYITQQDGSITYYIELNPYNYYTIFTNTNSSNRIFYYGFTNSLDYNSPVFDWHNPLVNSGDSFDLSFSGSNGYKYFVCQNYAGITPSIYFSAFPNRVSTLSSVNGYKLNTSNGFSQDGNTHFYLAYPVHEGFSYRILGVTSLTPMFYFSDIDQFNVMTSYTDYHPTNITGTDISGLIQGSIINQSQIIYNDQNGVFNYTYISSTGKFDFVSPFDGWFVFEYDQNSIPKIYTDYSGVDKPITTTNSNISNVNSSINNVNDSITDSSISDQDSDYDLPSVSVSSDTDSSFGNLFDKIYNAFTSEDLESFSIPIPYGDPIIIDGSLVSNINIHPVDTFLFAFWYYFFALIIVKDIGKKIELIRSGNVENIENSNIKEDIL